LKLKLKLKIDNVWSEQYKVYKMLHHRT